GFLVGLGPRRRIDDRVDAGERPVESLAGDHVDAFGTRDRDHVVSALPEDLDEMRSDSAGGSGDGHLLIPVFSLPRSFFHTLPSQIPRTGRFEIDSWDCGD